MGNEWVKGLWSERRWLFWLLIPVILIVFFKDVLIALVASSSRKVMKETREKDSELKNQIDSAKARADAAQREADRLEDKINNGNNVDEDWHDK